ncbi:MAG: hypothetical protein JST41_09240 [Bacteroidetes bacterium]|nr:hypothetical protein [Bacteroidota bacterium]MBX7129018.1 hypothetical protein [Flavobacteriales bacterium]MCC6840799.1 hypothetical protein [Flavobacteriales bacterium]HMU15261.1 hypothetical protein [Flavobacteriales bacterium]HMW96345.1 hypothetical protein [Flavobacteriales bacterium]
MRSLRHLATWTLLTVMVGLLVPREHWHELGHDGHAAEHATEGASITGNCIQCEVGLPMAVASATAEPAVPIVVRRVVPVEVVRKHSFGPVAMAADRGPPSTC